MLSSPDDPCECADDDDCKRECADGCEVSDAGTKRRRAAADEEEV